MGDLKLEMMEIGFELQGNIVISIKIAAKIEIFF